MKMKKFLIVLGVLVLLLNACAGHASNEPKNTSTEPSGSSQASTFPVVAELADEKRKEIKAALSSRERVDHTGHIELDKRFICGMRYYGTYNGYVILFDEGDYTWNSLKIGETEFQYGYPFQMYAYCDGKFHRLRTVYQDGKVTDAQITQILRVHAEFEVSGKLPYDSPTEGQRKAIQQAYTTLTGHDYAGTDDEGKYYVCDMRYYGVHNGYTILFCEGDLTVESGEQIGSEIFQHGSSFVLYAFRDGKVQKLKDVYEAGLLREEDIAYIAEIHVMFEGR